MRRALPTLRGVPGYGAYLRAVITTKCPLACGYCHMEGDPEHPAARGGLPAATWIELLCAAIDSGARKIKMVGGEPLVRRDLPEIIAAVRARDPEVDISVVTSGAVPRESVDRCFDAGLSRCNVTVHGFREEDFALRGGTPRLHALRAELIEAVLSRGRPTKINYVYTGPDCDDDLAALLDWGAPRACTIGLLDDLSRPDMGPETLLGALRRLRGEPIARWNEPDPHSLPALRLRLAGGPVVEIKDRRLGEVAPWGSCAVCLRRATCREGIVALRLTHTGELRPCMDRDDLGLALLPRLAAGGRTAVRDAWRSWLAGQEAA
jgi:GTP 3',8-cyclase